MRVVQAQDHDFEPWLKLAGEAEPLFGPLVRDDRFLDALRKNIARGSAFCVRAGEGGAGTPLLGGLLWSAHPPKYEIGWLVVSTSSRRRGVGRALVEHALHTVKGSAVVAVNSFAEGFPGGEAALAFYQRLGFVACVAPLAEHEHGRQWFTLAEWPRA
jgi:ribosomal protein S18 acetylase RimI-like enzyme